MVLSKTEIADLRKKYPAEYYAIRENRGKVSIAPRMQVIRVFANLLIEHTADLDKTIKELIQAKALGPEDFEQKQITVTKETATLLEQEAKRCKTRKIVYTNRLFE